MQTDPRVGIELPLRMLICQDADGTHFGYLDPRELADRYALDGRQQTLERQTAVLTRWPPRRPAERSAGRTTLPLPDSLRHERERYVRRAELRFGRGAAIQSVEELECCFARRKSTDEGLPLVTPSSPVFSTVQTWRPVPRARLTPTPRSAHGSAGPSGVHPGVQLERDGERLAGCEERRPRSG
jgi:hypothetical protein